MLPLIIPVGTTATRLFRQDLVYLLMLLQGLVPHLTSWCRLAPAKLGGVAPHAIQDDGKLARYDNMGLGHAAPLGDAHAQALSVDHF